MSEPKFTPGPWKTVYDTGCYRVCKADDSYNSSIAILPFTRNAGDNARLISLAPQLLKAVETLVHEQCQITCKDWDKPCTPTCWVLEYKKLIDEAKGEE